MNWLDVLPASVPVGVAAIPLLVLAFQLRQQNRLERKKVEVEYLRRALDAIDLPSATLIRAHVRLVELEVRRGQLSTADLSRELMLLESEWASTLEKFASPVRVAMAFARVGNDLPLHRSLAETFKASYDIGAVYVRSAKCLTEPDDKCLIALHEIPNAPEMVRERNSRIAAADRLIERIHRLYG
jgi:hypothetical protein